jgi:hypothetical protein
MDTFLWKMSKAACTENSAELGDMNEHNCTLFNVSISLLPLC